MLRVNNLYKSFKDFKAVRGVTFELKQGETLVIIGPSGSGKTTLLRLINDLETPDSGEIIKGSMGLVFQDFNLFPQYTVIENVLLAPKILKKNIEKCEDILKQLGIWDKKDLYPTQLSGGQKQRTAIARSLILNPEILCFDEPTSALDIECRQQVIKVIKDLKKEQTILIVTHDIELAKNVADYFVFMDGGKILENGSVDIINAPKNERLKVFLENASF